MGNLGQNGLTHRAEWKPGDLVRLINPFEESRNIPVWDYPAEKLSREGLKAGSIVLLIEEDKLGTWTCFWVVLYKRKLYSVSKANFTKIKQGEKNERNAV